MHPLRSFTDCNCGFFQLRSLLSFSSSLYSGSAQVFTQVQLKSLFSFSSSLYSVSAQVFIQFQLRSLLSFSSSLYSVSAQVFIHSVSAQVFMTVLATLWNIESVKITLLTSFLHFQKAQKPLQWRDKDETETRQRRDRDETETRQRRYIILLWSVATI